MRARRESREGLATVVLRGPLTLGEAPDRLLETVRSLLTQGFQRIQLDASRIPYADARGLGAIAECGSWALAAGAEFSVAGASGMLREELQITGLPCEPRGDSRAASGAAARRSGPSSTRPFLRVVRTGAA